MIIFLTVLQIITLQAAMCKHKKQKMKCSKLDINLEEISISFKEKQDFDHIQCKGPKCFFSECCAVEKAYVEQQGTTCGAVSILLTAIELGLREDLLDLNFLPADLPCWGDNLLNAIREEEKECHEGAGLWPPLRQLLSSRSMEEIFSSMTSEEKEFLAGVALPYRLNRVATCNNLELNRFIVPEGILGSLWKWTYLGLNWLIVCARRCSFREMNFLRTKTTFDNCVQLKEDERMVCLCVQKEWDTWSDIFDMHWIVKRPDGSIHNSTEGNIDQKEFDEGCIWKETGVGMVFTKRDRYCGNTT
jgi:hypothetical protein